MNQQFRYFAFISYCHADEKVTKWLHHKLESYRLPSVLLKDSDRQLPKQVRPIFRDEAELSSGPLEKALKEELSQSRFLIVMCSPNSAKSEWVEREVSLFISLRGAEFIIPVIVEGTPRVIDKADECLPPTLLESNQDLLWISFAGQTKEQVLLKTISALLDIRYDTLYDRHRRRQRRQRIWAASASTAVFVIVLTAAIFSFIQWNRAEQRRAEAEQLLNYLLVDLHPRLKQFGRLDLLENVANKSREYIDQLDTGVSDPIDAIQAVSLRRNMAEVFQTTGKLDAAEDLRQKNLEVLEKLARVDPEAEIILLLQGEEHQSLAGIRKTEGRFSDALKESQAAFSAFTSLVSVKSEVSWRSAKASSEQRLADAYYDLEMSKPAAEHIDSAISDFRRLLLENSGVDASLNLDLAYALFSKSRIVAKWGAISEAYPIFVEASDLFRRYLTDHSEDRSAWASFANVASDLAVMLKDMGRLEEAFQYWNLAIEAERELVTFEPLNVRWRAGLAETMMNQANALGRLGRPQEALHIYQEITDQRLKLMALEPNAAQWRASYAWCLHNTAIELTRLGRAGEAIAAWGKAIKTLDQLRKDGRAKREWLIDLSNMYAQRASIAMENGQMDMAVEDNKASQAIRDSLKSEADQTPRALAERGLNHARAALLAYHQKDYGNAISSIALAEESMRRAVELDKGNHEWSEHLAGILRNSGVIYRAAGEPEKAKTAVTESIGILETLSSHQPVDEELRADLSKAYNNLANVHCDLGNVKTSVEAWEKSLAINGDPKEAEYYTSRLGTLAYQYTLLGDAQKAEISARKALEVEPFAWIQINLGHALLLQGKRDEARAQYAKAIQQDNNAIESIHSDFMEYEKHGIHVEEGDRMLGDLREATKSAE